MRQHEKWKMQSLLLQIVKIHLNHILRLLASEYQKKSPRGVL